MRERSRAGIFNRINWEKLRPGPREGLVDSNASPVLLWQPGAVSNSHIGVSSIGSQADAMASVSKDYERWVNRVTSWVRRNGTKVWGPDLARPGMDVNLDFLNNVYALPKALDALENGAQGRS